VSYGWPAGTHWCLLAATGIANSDIGLYRASEPRSNAGMRESLLLPEFGVPFGHLLLRLQHL